MGDGQSRIGVRSLHVLANLGTRAAGATLKPVVDVADVAIKTSLAVERRSRATLGKAASQTILAGLDAALSSRYADEVCQHVLSAPVTEHAVGVALRGPLVDTVAREVADYAVLERLVTQMLATRDLDDMLQSGGADQLVAAVFASSLFEEIITRLLASDELWRLVEEIATSPAVTAAITQQGFGFIDQVGGEVRRRSRSADGWLERTARRLARRPPPADQPVVSAR